MLEVPTGESTFRIIDADSIGKILRVLYSLTTDYLC